MTDLATRDSRVQWEAPHIHLPTRASPSLLRITTLFVEPLNARLWVPFIIHTVSYEVCSLCFLDETEAQGELSSVPVVTLSKLLLSQVLTGLGYLNHLLLQSLGLVPAIASSYGVPSTPGNFRVAQEAGLIGLSIRSINNSWMPGAVPGLGPKGRVR